MQPSHIMGSRPTEGPLPTPLRVLILEDSRSDVELLLHELRRAGFEPRWQHVATEQAFLAGLAPPPDIILADYALPQFDALHALRGVQERAPDVPLIVVTGALSDEAAVACVKQGAADYLLKDRLGRLGEAVRQALAARDLRVQHRQAQDALRASEARFRALSEHASDLVGILDADGTYRYASPSHRRILGYAPAQVQGRNVFALMHPDDVPHTQAAFAALLQSPGAMETAEFRMRHADGSWRTLEGIGTNRLHDPAVRGIIANARDITERKRAEAERVALLARERTARVAAERTAGRIARLQAVTATLAGALTPEDIADAIIGQGLAALGTNTGSVVVLSDDATTFRVLRLAGYPPEVAATWREFPVDTSVPLADAVRAREVLTLETAQERRARYPHLAPITDPSRAGAIVAIPLLVGERAMGAIGLSFPTERHFDAEDRAFMHTLAGLCAQAIDRARLYEMEQQAHTRAAAAVRERDTFLSMAAHELKTPLTSLRGFAQVLLRVLGQGGPLDPVRTQRALRHIDEQTGKLSLLVDQLLDVARLQTGHLALDRRETDLAALVAEVAAAARMQTERHTLTVDAPPSAPAWVDPLRLEQVLTNLVGNAIKYSPGGGPIALTLAVDPGGATVRLAVRDRGLGIPAERRAHIFDRFYQAHADHHRSGLGLGLYISYEIVALHGGRLEAEFPEDGGARFIVTLPTGRGAGGGDDGCAGEQAEGTSGIMPARDPFDVGKQV